MNRLILVALFIIIDISLCCGQSCGDSSSHLQYRSLPGDSFRITKSIVLHDNSKILFGAFLEGASLKTPFLSKISSDGTVAWTNKLHSNTNTSNDFVLATIVAEATNGNIFLASVGLNPVSGPFILSIFSSDGALLLSKTLGIASNTLAFSNNKPSLIVPNGNDSMLLFFNYAASNTILDAMLIISVSNNGDIGQAFQTYFPPSSNLSRFQACRITPDEISIYGCGEFDNACAVNLRPQPAYEFLKIDRHTGQIIDRKSYCSPGIGFSNQGFELTDGDDTHNTSAIILNNGNVVFTRRIWGLDPGNPAVTHLFKVSTFDANMNHLKSEYISTTRSFQWFIDWDYDLCIESNGNRGVFAHDRVNQQLLYGKADINGPFSYQRVLPYTHTALNHRQNIAPYQEATFLLSALFVASDNNRSYIENIRILEQDTSLACFGTRENLFFSQPATVTPINWNGNFTTGPVAISENDVSVTQENYMLQRVIICNQTHFCNSIRLDGPELTCEQSTPIRIVAHRNPGCEMPILFFFDTTEIANYEHPDDSTLILHYTHPYHGKVIANLNGCSLISDTLEFTITTPPEVNLGKDIFYCPGKSYRLLANSSPALNYLWQDGTADSIFLASEPGLYYVTVTDLCQNSQNDSIRIIRQDFGIALGPDTTICIGQKLTLTVPPGYETYSWQPPLQYQQEQDNTIKAIPSDFTSYTVATTVFPGCIISDTINVTVQTCDDYLYFPNSFTPNNDGLNDSFLPVASRTVEKYELAIFNRWGQIVFITRQLTSGWSGYLNGAKQTGTFVWQCRFQFSGKPPKLQRGTVTVIR